MRSRPLNFLSVFALPALTLAACEPPPVNCTLEAVAALSVTVEDSAGAPVCDAEVTARDGEFEEVLESISCSYFGAFERPGTYEVTARRPGEIAVTSDIVVEAGECHVEPAVVELTLEPVGCTEEERPGLEITVNDSLGARVCDALVVARDGEYEELLQPFGGAESCTYSGAGEREGTYDLVVSRSGFGLETSGPITVASDFDGCHVVTESATVELAEIGACTASIEIGLSVTVLDDGGDPLCDATVVAEDGDFSETLTASGGACQTYLGVEERPGLYTVRASAPDHGSVLQQVIILTDGCHPILEEITVRLPGA